MPAERGQVISHYRLVEKIGAGGMGEVYRAVDSRLGREVAIKVLRPEYAADPERLRRFEREARAAGSLNHPGLLTLYDIGTHDGSPYIVTELLEGETLRDRLRHGPLPIDRAVDSAIQMARALAAAHGKGVVHRDLKPENLILASDGRVKILDFGLAKLIQPEPAAGRDATTRTLDTTTGVLFGTAGYMSPEQIRAQPTDSRSDLFAFGAVLYEMLSGRRAFAGESAVERLNAILSHEPPPLVEILPTGAGLDQIVRRCLERNVAQRFQSALDVAFALELVKPGSPQRAAPSPQPRWRIPAAAALALLITGAGAWLFARKTVPPPPSFQRLTFRRGLIAAARFAPDGHTIVYGAGWDGAPAQIFTTRIENPESSLLDFGNASILSISTTGELAILLGAHLDLDGSGWIGTLARVPLAGGAPRPIADDVREADWSPDGDKLAVVRRVSGRFRLEFPIGQVLYESDGPILSPRVSARGDRVAFLESVPTTGAEQGFVSIVDVVGKARRLSQQWTSLGGLTWAPARPDEIWFAAASRGSTRDLRAVTLSGKERVVLGMAVELTLRDISADGRVLLSRDLRQDAIVGLAPGERRERHLSWLDSSLSSDLSEDGATLLFTEYGEGVGPMGAVCLRRTDGSPVVRLGEGRALSLSPDGKWALAQLFSPQRLLLMPTGVGEPRQLDTAPLEYIDFASWFPDGRRIVVSGAEAGKDLRCYVMDVSGGKPVPLTPEGMRLFWPGAAVSPDGQSVIATDFKQTVALYPVSGGEARPVPGLGPLDVAVRWMRGGRSLLVYRMFQNPQRIYELDLSTGHRQPYKDIVPADPAGLQYIGSIDVDAAGRAYVYAFKRVLSDLYLVSGLR